MTCRHSPGDPNCSSSPYQTQKRAREEIEKVQAEVKAKTPDASNYTIVEFKRVGPHLVLKVLYPNCKKCSYEGQKVMVFFDVPEEEVIRWRKIDPHFRDPSAPRIPGEAPGPAARFPASPEGWADAVVYAQGKVK